MSVQILELEQKKKRVELQELYDDYDRYIRELNLESVDDREKEVLTNNVIAEDTIEKFA